MKKLFSVLFLLGVVFCVGCEQGTVGGNGELLVVDHVAEDLQDFRLREHARHDRDGGSAVIVYPVLVEIFRKG